MGEPLRLSPPRRRLRELLASLVTTTPQSISRCGRLALVLLTPSTSTSCFNDFAEVGTQSTFKGAEKLGELVQGPNMALVEAGEACGRANAACAAPPATWNGAPAVMATCYGSNCTTAGILATTGVIPVA